MGVGTGDWGLGNGTEQPTIMLKPWFQWCYEFEFGIGFKSGIGIGLGFSASVAARTSGLAAGVARLAAFHSATENAKRKTHRANNKMCACDRVAEWPNSHDVRFPMLGCGTRATLVDWLAGWLTGWQAGWLVGWLTVCWPGPKPFSTNSALRTTRQHTTTTSTTSPTRGQRPKTT